MKEGHVGVEQSRTALTRTIDFFEALHLIDDIVMEAGLAEIIFVFAVAHDYSLMLIFVFFHLPLTDVAVGDILHIVNCSVDATSERLSYFRFHGVILRTAWRFRVLHLPSEYTLKCFWDSVPAVV
jgi:hypothetical protein